MRKLVLQCLQLYCARVGFEDLDSARQSQMVLNPCCAIFSQANPQPYVSVYDRGIPLYYWDARVGHDFTNFGDTLSEKIVERIVGHRIATTFNKSLRADSKKIKLLAIGSIIHMAEDNDVIWGSGVNGKHPNKTDKNFYRFSQLDVRAVRGPLTRQFLMDMGIKCPAVYGDPALLLPKLFPGPFQPRSATSD